MKIKGILDTINSARDRSGNCYWAFRFTLTSNGRQVRGTISGGESNISAAFNFKSFRGWPWGAIYTIRHEMGWREFQATTSGWHHAGCLPEDIRNFVERELRRRVKA